MDRKRMRQLIEGWILVVVVNVGCAIINFTSLIPKTEPGFISRLALLGLFSFMAIIFVIESIKQALLIYVNKKLREHTVSQQNS